MKQKIRQDSVTKLDHDEEIRMDLWVQCLTMAEEYSSICKELFHPKVYDESKIQDIFGHLSLNYGPHEPEKTLHKLDKFHNKYIVYMRNLRANAGIEARLNTLYMMMRTNLKLIANGK